MEKVLSAIGRFFKSIWNWIKNTAWVQPLLIVILIFAIIFSINPIIKGVKSAMNSGEKTGSFYSAHIVKYNDLHDGKKLIEKNDECLVVYLNLEDATKKANAYSAEIYLKNFAKQNTSAKIYIVNIGSDNYLGDDKGKANNEATNLEYADLYNNTNKTDENGNPILPEMPQASFPAYSILYSSWTSTSGENSYLNNSDDITMNSPTYVKYKDHKATDMRFDLSSYTYYDNSTSVLELTVLTDLWKGTSESK